MDGSEKLLRLGMEERADLNLQPNSLRYGKEAD
jgi:hypothetical protein